MFAWKDAIYNIVPNQSQLFYLSYSNPIFFKCKAKARTGKQTITVVASIYKTKYSILVYL